MQFQWVLLGIAWDWGPSAVDDCFPTDQGMNQGEPYRDRKWGSVWGMPVLMAQLCDCGENRRQLHHVCEKNSWVHITATQNCLPDESPTGRTKGLRAEILSLLCKCIWSPAIPPALTVSVDSLIEGIPSLCTDNPHSQLSDCVCFGPIGWVYRWCQGWQYSLIDAKISLLFEPTGLNGECSSLL